MLYFQACQDLTKNPLQRDGSKYVYAFTFLKDTVLTPVFQTFNWAVSPEVTGVETLVNGVSDVVSTNVRQYPRLVNMLGMKASTGRWAGTYSSYSTKNLLPLELPYSSYPSRCSGHVNNVYTEFLSIMLVMHPL